MFKYINLKIKFRENFRPFAPAVLEEDIENYFKLKNKSPYMLIVTEIRDDIKITAEDVELVYKKVLDVNLKVENIQI